MRRPIGYRYIFRPKSCLLVCLSAEAVPLVADFGGFFTVCFGFEACTLPNRTWVLRHSCTHHQQSNHDYSEFHIAVTLSPYQERVKRHLCASAPACLLLGLFLK